MATMRTTPILHDGYYTVAWQGQHRTFRVHMQPLDSNFASGKQVISYLSGNGSDYTGFGFVIDGQIHLWKRFRSGYDTIIAAARFLVQGDHNAAGKMYAQQSGKCYVCNRLLTNPLSIASGIGPICASRIGVAREAVTSQAEEQAAQRTDGLS